MQDAGCRLQDKCEYGGLPEVSACVSLVNGGLPEVSLCVYKNCSAPRPRGARWEICAWNAPVIKIKNLFG